MSYPSVSIHPSDIDSNEATETFSDIIDLAGSKAEDLTNEQTSELKRLRASNIGLKEKMLQY